MENTVVEGNMSLRFDVPVSLKTDFEDACWKNKKTMSDVIRELMDRFVLENK